MLTAATRVKNLNSSTFRNVIVKAWIKENITSSMATIASNTTQEFNIAATGAVDDRVTKTLYLKIPINATTATNRTYSHMLYVRTYQSSNVAGECQESRKNINVSRLNHDLAIDAYEFSPKSTGISCNEPVNLYAYVWNTGLNDETDIKLNVQNSELGIDVTSGRFDLVAGDNKLVKLTFKLPDNTTKTTYSLTLRTYNENADKTKTIDMQIKDCLTGATITSFYSKEYNLIEAGIPHVFIIADPSIPVYEFRYKLNSNILDGKLSIDLLTGKPAIIADPPDAIAYKYLRMTTSFSSSYITYMTALFKVPDSWIKANDLDKNSVKLQRYADNTWTVLDSSFLLEEKGIVKYNSSIPAFSFFAITGTKAPAVHRCGDNA
jgi:PGF-pre-PGF domain-containing protein